MEILKRRDKFFTCLFIAITFEIEFHDCVVLCDLTNFDRIKKVHLNSFYFVLSRSRIEMQGNVFLFYPFIVDWVFCPLYSSLAFCVTIKVFSTTLLSPPRCRHIFNIKKHFSFIQLFFLLILFIFPGLLILSSTAHHRRKTFIPNQL